VALVIKRLPCWRESRPRGRCPLGHADRAVTLRVYYHVLREHTAGVGDIFAQVVKARVSKSVSNGGLAG
jgi:hypothetical protein